MLMLNWTTPQMFGLSVFVWTGGFAETGEGPLRYASYDSLRYISTPFNPIDGPMRPIQPEYHPIGYEMRPL